MSEPEITRGNAKDGEVEKIITESSNKSDTVFAKETINSLRALDSAISNLKEEADNLRKDFDRLETRTDKKSDFIQSLTVTISLAFAVALIFLISDYIKFSNNSYKIDNLQEQNKIFQQDSKKLECLKVRGYFSLKCL